MSSKPKTKTEPRTLKPGDLVSYVNSTNTTLGVVLDQVADRVTVKWLIYNAWKPLGHNVLEHFRYYLRKVC
jgi:hypothetical protein